MANSARTQTFLAQGEHFRTRLAAALAKVAWQVLEEAPSTANHAARAAYALQVVNGPANFAARLAAQVVMRTNVFSFATSFDYNIGDHITASGDPDLESQLATDWDELSGVIQTV